MQVHVQNTKTHVVGVALGVVRVGDAGGVTAETGVEGSLVRLGVEASARAENKDNLLFQPKLDLIPGFLHRDGQGSFIRLGKFQQAKKRRES